MAWIAGVVAVAVAGVVLYFASSYPVIIPRLSSSALPCLPRVQPYSIGTSWTATRWNAIIHTRFCIVRWNFSQSAAIPICDFRPFPICWTGSTRRKQRRPTKGDFRPSLPRSFRLPCRQFPSPQARKEQKNMRILFVTARAYLPQSRGGMQSSANELCGALQRRGHRVAVLAGLKPGGLVGWKRASR